MKTAGIMAVSTAFPGVHENNKKRVVFRKTSVYLDDQWDVIVVGGGPSGCTAAISAAREGARTLLIEATGSLGGMGTSGLLNAWCPFTDGEKIIYKGLAEQVLMESKKGTPHVAANSFNWVPINTEHLKRVYDDMVTNAGVEVLFFTRLAGVEMQNDNTVDAILVANKTGLTAFKAKVYVDCTGDGDLAAWAGADYAYGDEEGAVQAASLCFAISGIDKAAYNKESHRLHGGDKTSPIHQIQKSDKYPLVTDAHLNIKQSGPSFLMFNAGHINKLNSTDPKQLSQAVMTGRKIAFQIAEGLKEFEPGVFDGAYLAATGALVGVRESRRIKGDYQFSVEDWVERRSFDDEIGRNCYYVDIHRSDAKRFSRYGKGESHGIPYRCLTPEKLKNVLVAGRCISTDNYALGSVRVMPVCLVTGEAAGMAATHAFQYAGNDVHQVDVQFLRERLKEERQYLP